TVEKGDTANIDFEGFKDDIAFEGGKGEGYDLEIGSNTFIPGFEDQLIGMTAGEEKDINVTFPEDYQAEDLAGQPVVFKVKVNEIKTKSVPELTDELVKELKLYDAETVKDLEKSVKNEIRTRKQKDAESKMNDQILGAVVDGATVEIPEVMIEDETNSMLEDVKNRLAQQGLEMDFYLQMMGKTEQDLRDDYKEEAEKRVKTRLVLKAVAKAEGIEVSVEELEDEFKALADQYQMEVAQIKQYISGTTLGNDVRMRKAVDLVKTAATKKEKDA
ncbi:MAG: trigger factor, partial [Erysipelotrichaceae bacterium]|nr:trigger factor [Erysipelotrichaceae bacterium]